MLKNRPDWNCTYCKTSLTYKRRHEPFDKGSILTCPWCHRKTPYGCYVNLPVDNKLLKYGSVDMTRSANASGALFYDFSQVPAYSEESRVYHLIEGDLKSLVVK